MLELDCSRTALVIIDAQNFILGMPLAPHGKAEVVGNAVRLARAVRAGGGLVVFVRVGFSPGYADQVQATVDQPRRLPEGGLSEAALAYDPDLEAAGADLVITKRQWSAFHGTELDLQLRRRHLETVILGGVSTNFGVESTAREGWQHNYQMVIAEDACASTEEAMHRFSIDKILPRVARVRSTAQILEGLGLA